VLFSFYEESNGVDVYVDSEKKHKNGIN